MKNFLVILILLCAALKPALASGTTPKSSGLRANRIQFSYVPPKNPDHQAIYAEMKKREVLERFKEFLSPLRLPRPLRLKIAGCNGDANAFYDDDVVTVCYEYIDEIVRSAPLKTTPAGVTRMDAIAGPIVEVFFHEIAHALFDYYDLPVLGREEDAADFVAAYILLQFGKKDARRLIAGVAYTYGREALQPSTKKNPFADEHDLPAQRFYNVLCLAYGADPKLFGDVVNAGYLPKERAEGCDDEFKQVKRAMDKLVKPYTDQAIARKVRSKRWLRF